ncbi:molybdopterin molybdotransferase MoeA [Hymenobacter busanensis]|uniref:Molybdopterin molybdenumtransferase n=1 Tax=Hymenobacter busanensis TaxID=2607656 RepID=A0A7L4ZTH0_9BACT|nr:molybdopterin molybdotransferase MoeA [Hymenobacter busanensis]KAA9327547.1 molybdopterin molybdotransferase MoeA [Hymenobacter busanensis]QHJ06115.1 molybdopterin molybdenumtransferase MoeA [Hymenobacter busanensis]
MISVAEATRLVFSTVGPLPAETVALPQAAGRVLREPLHADRDFPPFDRVAMDGIALRFAALEAGQRAFSIARTQLAGQPPLPLEEPQAAVEIMTGAALPAGTDTVIRYEDLVFTSEAGRRVAAVQVLPPAPGHNVHRRATDRRQGDLLLPAGTLLGPAELGVAATIGAGLVTVARRPRVAVVSTGDELVPIDQTPLPHQIRRSNGLMLQAAAQQAGAVAELFHFDDDPAALRQGLPPLLREFDAVLLSGGVSKGQADFLPAALQDAGAEQLFHEVRQRPGKPFWFGRHPAGAVVFALPGNPVSTFVNYYRYAAPWLRAVQQPALPMLPVFHAVLATDVVFRPALTHFLLVRLVSAPDGRLLAYPLDRTQNSGDLASLLLADGFVELPAERETFAVGEAVPVWRFRY